MPATGSRFTLHKDHPIEFLAIHDASITSLAVFREVIASIRKEAGVDTLPFRMLLDRPPAGKGTGPYPAQADEQRSGQTSDRYEIVSWPSTFVIDQEGRVVLALMFRGNFSGLAAMSYRRTKDGKLFWHDEDESVVGKDGKCLERSGMDALEGAIEELLGLPRSHRTVEASRQGSGGSEPERPTAAERSKPPRPIVVKGTVYGLDGAPIEGAKVSAAGPGVTRNEVKTGRKGEFGLRLNIEVENPTHLLTLKAEAPGMAPRIFSAKMFPPRQLPETGPDGLTVDAKGELSQPLFLGPGVTVAGRVVRDGKPVPSIALRLDFVESGIDHLAGTPETKTDLQGAFQFEHVLPNTQFAAYAECGSLKRGGAITPRLFQTGEDGTTVDLGQLLVEQGKTLAGRIVFSDGKTPYQKAALNVYPENAGNGVEVNLDEKGHFRIEALPRGPISIHFSFDGQTSWVGTVPNGYRVSRWNKCLDPRSTSIIKGRLDRDITDLTILFEPDDAPHSSRSYLDLDPTVVADFEDAAAGPITGVPPQSVNGK